MIYFKSRRTREVKVKRNAKRLKLENYKSTVGDIQRFRIDIFNNLGDEIFEIKDWSEFLYETLRQVSPIYKWINRTDASILKAVQLLNKHFFKYKATLKRIDKDGINDVTVNKTDIELYTQQILCIDKLPRDIYKSLNGGVLEDLRNLNDLIKRYENDDYIKLFISKNQIPRNQEDGIRFDFYQRCIAEQRVILDFYLNNLKPRVIQKSAYLPSGMSAFINFGQEQKDFPYRFHFLPELFDHTLIREASHRVGNFEVRESFKMEDLYIKNKKLFYRRLLQNESIEQVFSDFNYYLQHLPFKNNRKVIFDEIKKLYKAKNWMALFAVALPQVEGLFTEMCNLAYPDQISRSLGDKVNKVRPLYFMSESYFDYYQYSVSKLRNSFMHTGYNDDFELKALDLVFDLRHLLHVFHDLKHPEVKLKRLHTYRKPENFTSFIQYGQYFSLLEQLTQSQRDKYANEISSFEKDFLTNYCDADFICGEVIDELPKYIQSLTVKIEYAINSADTADQLSTIPLIKAKKLVTDTAFFEQFANFCTYNYRELEALEGYYFFLRYYKKHLPSLQTETVKHMSLLKGSRFIENIYELKKLCLIDNN